MHITEQQKAQEALRIAGANAQNCIQCGKCSASCPAAFKMDILPHRFVWELLQGKIHNLQQSKSIYKCVSCFNCTNRCPRGVDPAALIEAVRLSVIRRQGGCTLKPDDIGNLLDENMPQQAIVSAFRKYNK